MIDNCRNLSIMQADFVPLAEKPDRLPEEHFSGLTSLRLPGVVVVAFVIALT